MKDMTINSISLKLEDWELKEDTESMKSWYNSDGDKLSLNFFLKEPDLPKDASNINDMRIMYRGMITQAKGAIVEVEKDYVGSLLAVKTIFKFPQDPSGFAFLGSYTVPREDFSLVLKVQCPERGPTGMREAVILDKAMGEGLVENTKEGWFSDPYDPEFKAPVLSNIADREEYDEKFPKHPLSKVRKTLKLIKDNVGFSDEILNSKKFFLNIE